jgi:hypothetical protein
MRMKLFWKDNPVGVPRGEMHLKDVPAMVKKAFSPPSGDNAREFEAEINAWLSERPGIRIADIKQSAGGGTYSPAVWLITVWYEDGE